jgi:folate-binding protein YgfZ
MISIEEKNTLLIEFLESKGYTSFPTNGFKIINRYSDLDAEIDSLYNGVSLRNISHLGLIELKGKDALDIIHRIGTNSINDLPKEGVRNTIFTSEKGRIIGLSTLLNFEDYQILVSSRANKQKVMSWINKYIISDDVEVNDANTKYNLLELSGPQADSFATLICGKVVGDINQDSFKIVQTENLLFFLVRLTSERKFDKFWFLADFDNTRKLINYMQENKGIFNFNLVGEQAYESFRIEQGIPSAPNELNDQYNPHEAGLTDWIDFNKGCYIGQEVIARLQTYDKVQKKLTGVKFMEPVEPGKQFTLFDESGAEAGRITSTNHSLRLNEPIGLAYIRNSYLTNGDLLTAKSDTDSVSVEIHSLPFTK